MSTDSAFGLFKDRLDKDLEVFWKRHMEDCSLSRLQQLKLDLKRHHLLSSERWMLASTVFDSFLQPAMAGVRGTPSDPTRQFVLRDEEFDIHIKVSGDGIRRQIRGQMLPREGKEFAPAARCHLLRNGTRFQSTSTDETGEFQFSDVPEGDLSLQIDLPDLTIVGSFNTDDTS